MNRQSEFRLRSSVLAICLAVFAGACGEVDLPSDNPPGDTNTGSDSETIDPETSDSDTNNTNDTSDTNDTDDTSDTNDTSDTSDTTDTTDTTDTASPFLSMDEKRVSCMDTEPYCSTDDTPDSDTIAFYEESPRPDPKLDASDIIISLDADTLLSLNQYRGFSIVDVTDPGAPVVTGRFEIQGRPVALYADAAAEKAWIVLNDHSLRTADGIDELSTDTLASREALIVALDLTDRQYPSEIKRISLQGDIVAEQLVLSADKRALYVASEGEQKLTISGFRCEASGWFYRYSLIEYSVQSPVVQKGPGFFFVAGDFSLPNVSNLHLVDISAATGLAVSRGALKTWEKVERSGDMSMSGDILRVVANDGWGDQFVVETWNIADPDAPVFVEQLPLNGLLWLPLFLGNNLMLWSGSPQQTLYIDDAGNIEEPSVLETIDYDGQLQPVFNDSRLMQIACAPDQLLIRLNDADVYATTPLIDEVVLDWDIRCYWDRITDKDHFAVLENAVSVLNDTGTEETGLILLPFEADIGDPPLKTPQLHILTFSPDSITDRGVMTVPTLPETYFALTPGQVFIMGDGQLSLLDFSTLSTPEVIATTDIAPFYSDYLVVNETHGLRVRTEPSTWKAYLPDSAVSTPAGSLSGALEGYATVIPYSPYVLPDVAVHPAAQAYPMGTRPIVVSPDEDTADKWNIEVIDFTDPVQPLRRGSLSTALPGYLHAGDTGTFFEGCYGIGCTADTGRSNARIIGNALVIARLLPQDDPGTERSWQSYQFDIIDLSNPDAPIRRDPVVMDSRFEAAGLVVNGDTLLVNHKEPCTPTDDNNPCVSSFVTFIDLSNPAEPEVSEPVGIPGTVFAIVDGDLISRDWPWQPTTDYFDKRTILLHRLRLENRQLSSLSSISFAADSVHSVVVEDSGRVFVTVGPYYPDWMCFSGYYAENDFSNSLQVLRLEEDGVSLLGAISLDGAASVQRAHSGVLTLITRRHVRAVNLNYSLSGPFRIKSIPTHDAKLSLSSTDHSEVLMTAGHCGFPRVSPTIYMD